MQVSEIDRVHARLDGVFSIINDLISVVEKITDRIVEIGDKQRKESAQMNPGDKEEVNNINNDAVVSAPEDNYQTNNTGLAPRKKKSPKLVSLRPRSSTMNIGRMPYLKYKRTWAKALRKSMRKQFLSGGKRKCILITAQNYFHDLNSSTPNF